MAHHRCAINSHIRCAISRGFSSSGPLMPTSASAPLRSAALPSRTHHRAPPASTRRQRQLHHRPRKWPPRRAALVVPSPLVPRLTLNRKARSLLSCGRMSTCLHGNRLISPVFQESNRAPSCRLSSCVARQAESQETSSGAPRIHCRRDQ